MMTASADPSLKHIKVLLFAHFAEIAGVDSWEVSLSGPATVEDVVQALRRDVPAASALPDRPLCARNQSQARLDETVNDGDEIALLPPLAGG